MITSLISAVFLLGFCIFFHELGHYLVGRWCGVKAKIFSIGYGKALWYKRKGKTIFQIGRFPLGGYVQFYGDNPAKKYTRQVKGHFFSASPFKRILIAAGGPVFSLLLGLLVMLALVFAGWQPISNEITISHEKAPAKIAGLQNGDKIIEVNGNKIASFEELSYYIGFSAKHDIEVKALRGDKELQFTIKATEMEPGMPLHIGVSPVGKRILEVSQEKIIDEKTKLLAQDRIIQVNGKNIADREELLKAISPFIGGSVALTVLRQSGNVVDPTSRQQIVINFPVKSMAQLKISNLLDFQTGSKLADREIGEWMDGVIDKIRIKERNFETWKDLEIFLLNQPNKGNYQGDFFLGPVQYRGSLTFGNRAMLGIGLSEQWDPKKAELPGDFFSRLQRSYEQTVFTAKSTIVGLVRLIEGKLSFEKSVSGPVKIAELAYKSVSLGWATYWFLLANITIILGIMNLLPIPVLDGGHIVFYTVEMLYKPIDIKIIAAISRVFMLLLIGLGIYVIGMDIWNVFIKKIV